MKVYLVACEIGGKVCPPTLIKADSEWHAEVKFRKSLTKEAVGRGYKIQALEVTQELLLAVLPDECSITTDGF